MIVDSVRTILLRQLRYQSDLVAHYQRRFRNPLLDVYMKVASALGDEMYF
jgi:hypothetical protein